MTGLEGPDFAGTDRSTSKEVLDTLVLGVGDTGGTVLDLESSSTRVDLAGSVFAIDIFEWGSGYSRDLHLGRYIHHTSRGLFGDLGIRSAWRNRG
jgi:hypothetical protein